MYLWRRLPRVDGDGGEPVLQVPCVQLVAVFTRRGGRAGE